MADDPLETGLIGGVEKREISIVDYDERWPQQFESHAKIIADALGATALRIEHIGSTAVPGLGAKPIIDILVVVEASPDEATYLRQLEAAAYELRVREPDGNEHRMFRTPERDVHIHVYSRNCQEIERYLMFRDRLRRNADDRNRYERTKRELATRSWPDMNAYAEAKSEVVESVIAAARVAKREEPLDKPDG
jgi:GrpB-like predicted nucleotidyltransferase (UPF0157 family)